MNKYEFIVRCVSFERMKVDAKDISEAIEKFDRGEFDLDSDEPTDHEIVSIKKMGEE